MRVIKNRKIFLVQIATRPFPKHIYRSLRAILNSTLTGKEFGSFQTQPIHQIEGSKPSIYTFYTKTRQIPYSNPYKTLDYHTRIHTQFVASIPVIFFVLSFFLLFFSLLLLLLLFFFFFFLSLLFFLIRFSLSFSKTKMRYLFWSYPYLILSAFYFTFLSFGASLTIQSKEEASSLSPSSHLSLPQFSSLFHSNIFLLLLFGPPTLYYS